MNPKPMGPLAADHPLVTGDHCCECGAPFAAGEFVTLIPKPPEDEEAKAAAREGRAYTTEATVVHWDCAIAAGLVRE